MSQQWHSAAAGMTNQGLHIPWVQAHENFGWKNGVRLWCNPVEKGPGFSDSGYAMARILWIHYLSKVRQPMLLQAVAITTCCAGQGAGHVAAVGAAVMHLSGTLLRTGL